VRSKFALRTLFGLALGLMLAACSGGGAAPTAAAQTVGITTADTFVYTPNTFTGKVGQPIHVSLKNNANGLVHSFVIDEMNVKLDNIAAQATADVTFTPTTAGTFVFYCDTPGHKAAGMTGTITITQ
jgi:uncharacterized cupredoxin-like copper-binding protein